MTEVLNLEAQLREKVGTSAARENRRNKHLIGVIYGENEAPQHIVMDPRPIEKHLTKTGFFTHLFNININGKSLQVLPKDIQFHPVTDQLLHIDFIRVSKNSRITVNIPIRFINEDKSPGIKKGGVFNAVMHEIQMRCSPGNIPQEIIVDLAGQEANTVIHLKDLPLPENADVLHASPDQTIATIQPPKVSGKDSGAEAAETA